MLLQATITTGTGIDPWIALIAVIFSALLSAASVLATLRMLNPNAFKAAAEGKKAVAEGGLIDAQAVQQRAETLNWLYQRLEELTKQQELLLEKNRDNSTQIDSLKGQNMEQQGQMDAQQRQMTELKRLQEEGQLERAAIVAQLQQVYSTFDSVVRPAMAFVQDATLKRQEAVRERLVTLEAMIAEIRVKLDRAAELLWAEAPAQQVKALLDEANADLAQLAAQIAEIREYQDKATQEFEDGLRPALDEITRIKTPPASDSGGK